MHCLPLSFEGIMVWSMFYCSFLCRVQSTCSFLFHSSVKLVSGHLQGIDGSLSFLFRCSTEWMKQSLARTLLILSLVLSLITFILSLIALHLPKWKSIQLRTTFRPIIIFDHQPMDPLIRGEVEKYIGVLYRRGNPFSLRKTSAVCFSCLLWSGEKHSFGLSTHCLVGGRCGRNLLPTFDEINYSLCHHIDAYQQCLSSELLTNSHEGKCRCEQPDYLKIIHKFLISLILLQIVFFCVNALRLCRRHCSKHCLNDIQLRLISLISSLVSLLFLIIIIIQHTSHRRHEPLQFFEAMRQHYSRIQIYTFSKDLESILQQIEHALDVRMGGSFLCVLLNLVLTFTTFLTSITVEMKSSSASPSLTLNDEEEKRHYHSSSRPHTSIDSVPSDRFVPSEQIRYARQTKVWPRRGPCPPPFPSTSILCWFPFYINVILL